MTILAYLRILYYLYKKAQQVAPIQVNSQDERIQRAATKMASIILGVYFGTYLPKLIIIPFAKTGAPQWTRYATSVAQWILHINSWINPWLYAWKNKDFKEAFQKILRLNTTTVQAINIVH